DRPLHARIHERGERVDVLQPGDPARGDHGSFRAAADLAQEVEVRALQGPVLGDVGDDVAGAAVPLEPFEHLPQVPALFRPTATGEGRAPYVEPDGDPVPVFGDDLRGPLGFFQRGGAEVDAAAAGCQRAGEG